MKIIISNILKSNTAAYQDEGHKIYDGIVTLLNSNVSFELSFEGLETCSTLFLNASVGKLYRNFSKELIDFYMKITGIEEDDTIMPKMINRSISKALNVEFYETIRNQAFELA